MNGLEEFVAAALWQPKVVGTRSEVCRERTGVVGSTPPIGAAFGAFDLEAVSLTYTISDGDSFAASELIVTTRGLPRADAAPDLFGEIP